MKLYNKNSLKSLKAAIKYHIAKLKTKEEVKAYITKDSVTRKIVKNILKAQTHSNFFIKKY